MTAIKLLSLVGAAAVSAGSSSSSSVNNMAAAAASSTFSRRTPSSAAITPASTRLLSDYVYLDSLSGYSLKYSHCVRVKIPQYSDDDEVEGNVNFYNGRYHAQYSIYATFHVCGDGNYDPSSQCSASACDYDVEYAAPMDDYLKSAMQYWQRSCEYDGSSSASCSYFGNNDDAADDESRYTDCVAAYQEDGMQLYYGPQCSDDGSSIVVGVFYDDECTIKTKHESPSFEYNVFKAVESSCVDCSSDMGQNTCGNLYGVSYHCKNGMDQRGQEDDMSVCATVKKVMTSVDYSGVKKRHSGADLFLKVFLTCLTLSMVGFFLFGSYSYYYRHKLAEQEMKNMDGHYNNAGYEGEGGHGAMMGGGTLT
ncbi:hypothetical protein ACHAXA_000179 [Cyclostephanos tholiformis]|uniref:Uncharacterized protein n=1 Tax=Cyclostephanos tholiformis TaxID=382380 RepID=A0ABD3R7A0_9STRA